MALDATALRHELHRAAERSGEESRTAGLVVRALETAGPDELWTEVGGQGIVATFRGDAPGPRILIRCELDALAMPETLKLPHASTSDEAAHKCGHDGHMAIVLGLADRLRAARPATGEVALLFQPAEETGEGALRVLEDPRMRARSFDWAFALHNLPGRPEGSVVLREGSFAAASTGLVAALEGATSHAAEPERGRSPALAMAWLVQAWSALPQTDVALGSAGKLTVIHAKLGEPAFGTSPGHAEVMATLRAFEQPVMDRLLERARDLARHAADAYGLDCRTRCVEAFPATVNHAEAVARIERAARSLELPIERAAAPFAWSEDFGHFTGRARGALFGLGAGEDHPPLHHPRYDFPDALLEPGADLFERLVRDLTR